MDDSTDASEGEQQEIQPPLLPIEEVQIVSIPDFNNLQPVLPAPEDEIPYEDLLGFVNAPQNDPKNFEQQHVGLAQMPDITVDPLFYERFQSAPLPKLSSEAFKLWVKFFSSNSNSSSPIVIPDNWMAFFIFLLLQSPTFSCAKEFLRSKAQDFFSNNLQGNSSIFYLPSSCPSVNLTICPLFQPSSVILQDLDDLDSEQANSHQFDASAASTPGTPAKKQRLSKPKQRILSAACLMRSVRLKKVHKGFRSTACKDKNCVGCSTTPPSVSPSIIKDFGASFCNINPDDLTEENLIKQPKEKLLRRHQEDSQWPFVQLGNAPQ